MYFLFTDDSQIGRRTLEIVMMEKDVTTYLGAYAKIFLQFNANAAISVRNANAKILKSLVRLSNEKECVKATRCPKYSSTIVQKLVKYVGKKLMT